MIKNLKSLCKLIEGLMWLYLPIVLFYWALTLVELNAIASLKAFIGVIVQPLIETIDNYFDFQVYFRNTEVDYTPVILAIGVAFSACLFWGGANALDVLEKKLENAKIDLLKRKESKKLEKEKEAFVEELDKNRVLYVMLKLIKIEKHDNYLIKNDKDSFSVGFIDSYETSIKNIATNFSGKSYIDFDAGAEITNFIFTDTEQFILYLIYLDEKVKEINKGTADLNTVFSYSLACSCSYSTTTAEIDFQLTNKLLNLVGKEEIFITSVLKNKLENLNTDMSMKFESKGIYMLDNKHIDTYKLKIN